MDGTWIAKEERKLGMCPKQKWAALKLTVSETAFNKWRCETGPTPPRFSFNTDMQASLTT
jgi:hypothetical protein